MLRLISTLVLTLTVVHADDITLRDGKIYKDAKVVSHDATNITILYAEGGATLPIAQLPDDLQKKYGNGSVVAPDSSPGANKDDWSGYHKAQDKYVLVNGQLVTRSSVNVTTLNVKLNHVAEVKSAAGENLGRGSLVDIYEGGNTVVADPSAAKPTGESAFLKDYVISSDKIVKIEAIKTGATDSGGLYYVLAQPFSFDVWKKAGSPQ